MTLNNGYTKSVPVKNQIENLLLQVPQEYRNQAAADCMQDNPHDFVRHLTSYVLCRAWVNPVDEAQQIEREIDKQLKRGKATLYANLLDENICFSRGGNDRYYKSTPRRVNIVKSKSSLIIGTGGLRISK